MTLKSNVCGLPKRGIITCFLDFWVLYCRIERDGCTVIAFYFCKYLLGNLSLNLLFGCQVSCLDFRLQKLEPYDSSAFGFSDFA